MFFYPFLFYFARLFPLHQLVCLSAFLSVINSLTQAHGHAYAHGSLIQLKNNYCSYLLTYQWSDRPADQTTYWPSGGQPILLRWVDPSNKAVYTALVAPSKPNE